MQSLKSWLQSGPFTLTMSSGYFGFFAHAGVLAALEEHDLTPSAITGSSAGALIGALFASGVKSGKIRSILFNLARRDFWDPKPGLGFLQGEKFRELLTENLGCSTFSGCDIPLRLSVFDAAKMQTVVVKDGDLVRATYASCALPGLFQPIRENWQLLFDGGVRDRPGLAGIAADERVLYHHLFPHTPWRFKRGPDSMPKDLPGECAVLALPDLPRVGPLRLRKGPEAYNLAKDQTLRMLAQMYISQSN